MGRFVLKIICFVFVYALLYVGWVLYSNLKLFPNDIIGTGYQVHLPNKYELIILEFDFCQIEDGEYNIVVDEVDSLQVIGDVVIGRDTTGLFLLQTNAQTISYYSSSDQLKMEQGIDDYSLISPIDFYWKNRRFYDILANSLIAVLACFCSYMVGRTSSPKEKHSTKEKGVGVQNQQ
jgi:hypothetical protein